MNKDNAWEVGGYAVHPLVFGGHSLLAREVHAGEQDDDGNVLVGGIVMPRQVRVGNSYVDVVKKISNWLQVIGIGPRVCQPCSKAHMHVFGRCKCMSMAYSKGDLILVPDYAPNGVGLAKSPFSDEIWFVEESVPLAVWRGEQE